MERLRRAQRAVAVLRNDLADGLDLIKAKLDATFGKDALGVINAGIGNSGNGRWIKLLKTEADQFKPRLVREASFRVSDSGALHELPIKTQQGEIFGTGPSGL
jgi:hypothetical protein